MHYFDEFFNWQNVKIRQVVNCDVIWRIFNCIFTWKIVFGEIPTVLLNASIWRNFKLKYIFQKIGNLDFLCFVLFCQNVEKFVKSQNKAKTVAILLVKALDTWSSSTALTMYIQPFSIAGSKTIDSNVLTVLRVTNCGLVAAKCCKGANKCHPKKRHKESHTTRTDLGKQNCPYPDFRDAM